MALQEELTLITSTNGDLHVRTCAAAYLRTRAPRLSQQSHNARAALPPAHSIPALFESTLSGTGDHGHAGRAMRAQQRLGEGVGNGAAAAHGTQLHARSAVLLFVLLFCCHCILVDGTNSAGARKPRPTAQERIAFLEREAREQLERREARDARSARLSPSRVHSVRLQDDSPRLTAEEDRRASRSPGRMARSYRDIDGQDDSWAHSRTSSFEGSPSAVFGTASRFPSPPRLMVTD